MTPASGLGKHQARMCSDTILQSASRIPPREGGHATVDWIYLSEPPSEEEHVVVQELARVHPPPPRGVALVPLCHGSSHGNRPNINHSHLLVSTLAHALQNKAEERHSPPCSHATLTAAPQRQRQFATTISLFSMPFWILACRSISATHFSSTARPVRSLPSATDPPSPQTGLSRPSRGLADALSNNVGVSTMAEPLRPSK